MFYTFDDNEVMLINRQTRHITLSCVENDYTNKKNGGINYLDCMLCLQTDRSDIISSVPSFFGYSWDIVVQMKPICEGFNISNDCIWLVMAFGMMRQ